MHKSLSKTDARMIKAHVVQYRLARGAQVLALGVGGMAALTNGWHYLILGFAFAGLFGLAKPEANERFDRMTGRGE